jgi:hypothetical protein
MRPLIYKYLGIVLLLGLFLPNLQAQQQQGLAVGLKLFPSMVYNGNLNYGYGGSGVYVNYRKKVAPKIAIVVGLETSVVGWGSQSLLEIGINNSLWQKDRLGVSVEWLLLQGLAWYQPKPLHVWGSEVGAKAYWKMTKRSDLVLSAGLRYTTNPNYRSYGAISSYIDVPVKVGLVFHKKEQQEIK